MRLALTLREIAVAPLQPETGYREVTLGTDRGDIECRWYDSPGATRAAVWVGGVGGGFDTPARGLYPKLCEELTDDGISSLRIRFRNPRAIEEAALDVVAGVRFLQERGIETVALIGHSFGGAVVLMAGAAAPSVKAIVTLATQSYGADAAASLGADVALLAIHGADDDILPPTCSRYVHDLVGGPKRLVLHPGAGHGLDEAADAVHVEVGDWIRTRLATSRPNG